jgi:hypothetical protein
MPANLQRLILGLRLIGGTLACLWLAGCAGYKLGPTGGQVAGHRSIEIRPFADQTREPRLIEPVATALRKEVQRDGTLQLATSEPGDILVTGTLVEYTRHPLTFQPSDVFTTRDYEIRLPARVLTHPELNVGQSDATRRARHARRLRLVPRLQEHEKPLELGENEAGGGARHSSYGAAADCCITTLLQTAQAGQHAA